MWSTKHKEYTGKVIDLTLTYEESIAGFSSEQARTVQEDGWNAKTLHIYSHSGTHMDAPVHFGLEGTIDEFGPDQFMGKAWIIDISPVPPKMLIEVQHLGAVANLIELGDSLILKTNWSQFLHDRAMYRDQLPRISKELAEWIVKKGIKMLGVEPPSVADVNNIDEVTKIHHILLKGNVIIIEGLTNLIAIHTPVIWLMAFPLKIKNGDGAPARVLAIELEE